jgi:Nucleotidyl transferase of unknown function (DUF2204)
VPRRGRALLSQLVYRNPPIPPERVVTAMQALEEAGVKTVLMGGWGVDALVGRQLRPHADLDLLADESEFEVAIEILTGLGYEPWNHDSGPGPIGNLPVSAAQTLRDGALRVVELHAVDLRQVRPTEGIVAGKRVFCLTAEHQLQAQKVMGKTWTPQRRLKRQRNLAAVQGALQRGPERV